LLTVVSGILPEPKSSGRDACFSNPRFYKRRYAMSKIRIETELVREMGHQMRAEAEQLAEIGRSLQAAIRDLDTRSWDGISRARAEPMLESVRGQAARVADDLAVLGRKLATVADTFEHQDQAAARGLEGMPWVEWGLSGGGPSFRGDPTDDRPDFRGIPGTFGVVYGRIGGSAFILGDEDGNSIHPNDVDQGGVGDCFLLAPLAGIALQDPDMIADMVQDNGDGTFTVTLYDRPGLLSSEYDPVEVVVTSEFPMRFGRPVFAGIGDISDGGQRELWPMIVEKAYAQHHDSYNNLQGGYSHVAMEELVGVDSDRLTPPSIELEDLAGRFDKGQVITVASMPDSGIRIGGIMIWDIPDPTDQNPLYQDGTLVASHEYYITGVDSSAETVSMRNPWGWEFDEVTLSFTEFQESFRRVSIISLTE
jgi:uncharacterized protein YukE